MSEIKSNRGECAPLAAKRRRPNGFHPKYHTKWGFISNIFEENVQSLKKLHTDETWAAATLSHDAQEKRQHVLFQKETANTINNKKKFIIKISWLLLKYRWIILIAPNKDLGDWAQGLHQQAPVVLRHSVVLHQHIVEVLQMLRGVRILRAAPATTEPAAAAEHRVR